MEGVPSRSPKFGCDGVQAWEGSRCATRCAIHGIIHCAINRVIHCVLSQVQRWAKQMEGFSSNPEGLPPADAAQIILNGVEDGAWRILVGDDAEALDKGVRSLPLGDAYPLGEMTDASVAVRLAKLGDPTWTPGRHTQLARRREAAAKL